MLHLYWSIGDDIVKRNAEAVWGKSVINQLSQDLRDEFTDMRGFSLRNLAYMKQFYLFYSDGEKLQQVAAKSTVDDDKKSLPQVVAKIDDAGGHESLPQAVAKSAKDVVVDNVIFSISRGHHRYILDKIKDVKEALFYVHKTIENGWSRNVLLNMLDTKLYEVQGKAITNILKSAATCGTINIGLPKTEKL